MSNKLWEKNFEVNREIERFTVGNDREMDRYLAKYDVLGSMAHITMLAHIGLLEQRELTPLLAELKRIYALCEAGTFEIEDGVEDVHSQVELMLTRKLGDMGKKIHSGRSRNDQVALDTHLYLRRATVEVAALLLEMQRALVETAEKYADVLMPGYTHLQRAQPILFAHHLMAYFAMLGRDFDRFSGVYRRADLMPLGAGALAGTTFPIDRTFTAQLLHFDALYTNSLDAVSDRDYIMEFLSAASILMVHLSRLSEEIILWCSREFSFVELDDAHCTGSSMMPQKKNPDVSELVRGKTGRVIGHLMAMMTTVKGLPLAYNKDLQEDKEGVFDAIDTVTFSLAVYARLLRGMKVNRAVTERAVAEDFSNATDLADYLAKKGLPFREAHAVAGRAVHYAMERGKWLTDLTAEEFQSLSPLLDEGIREVLRSETCVKNRDSLGGTSYHQVERQIEAAKVRMAEEGRTVEAWQNKQICAE